MEAIAKLEKPIRATEILRQTSLDNQTLRALVKRGLAELREDGVSYVFAGPAGDDLPRALEEIAALLETALFTLGIAYGGVAALAATRTRLAQTITADTAEPVDDAVASAAYRRKILPLLVRVALDRLESA